MSPAGQNSPLMEVLGAATVFPKSPRSSREWSRLHASTYVRDCAPRAYMARHSSGQNALASLKSLRPFGGIIADNSGFGKTDVVLLFLSG